MRVFYTIAFWGILNVQTFCQLEHAEHFNFQDSVESLTYQIQTAIDPRIKANKLVDLSFYQTDYNKSIANLRDAKEIALNLGDSKLETSINIELAMVHMFLGNIGESVELFDSNMPNYKNDVDEYTYYLAEYQHCKALITASKYYESLERSLDVYNYYDAQDEKSVYVGLTAQLIASIYKKLGRNQDAIDQYEISIQLCTELDHPNCVTSSFQNIAYLNLEQDDIDKANNNLQKAKEAILNHPPLQWQKMYINLLEGKIRLEENNPDEAIRVLNKSFQNVQNEKWNIQIARYHLQYAKAYLAKGQLNRALQNSSLALKIGNEKQSKSISQQAHQLNALIFEKLGDTKKALDSYRNYISIYESVLSAEKVSQINELDAKYKKANIESKLNLLEKENAIKALEIQKGNQRKTLLYGGASIPLILLLMLYYFFRKKSETNQILKEKNQIINKSLQDKDILLREIHHRVKNNLQVVSSLLNLQANYISDDNALKAINEGKNRVSSMALIHQNLYQEENLTAINSKDYFDDLIDNLFESYNIDEKNIELSKDIDDLEIDVDTMIPLGLIVNELVSNSLKHAFKHKNQQGKITVRLFEKSGVLTLSISDNGIGTTEDHFFKSDSFGNKMINAFKQKLNAEIKIENENGTKVTINIKNYKLNAA